MEDSRQNQMEEELPRHTAVAVVGSRPEVEVVVVVVVAHPSLGVPSPLYSSP